MIAAVGTAGRDAGGWVRLDRQPGQVTLHAGGRWDLGAAAALDRALGALDPGMAGPGTAIIDLGDVTALDTVGAWLVRRTAVALEAAGLEVRLDRVDPSVARLLEEVRRVDPPARQQAPPRSSLMALVEDTGRATIDLGFGTIGLLGFLGLLLSRLGNRALRPWKIRWISVIHHMQQTGVEALPIVGLLSFLIGVVLAYQGAQQLRDFGAEILVADLLGIGILRELGILITAIIIAGRSGSAFTAEIGTMKVNQEVDALATIGLDPIDILVIPRVIALMITLPLVTFFADIAGLVGGALMADWTLGISTTQFVDELRIAVGPTELFVGLVKAPVFAFTIAMVGCMEGLKVTGSAESVGRLTTRSVVESIFLVIVLDALFSILFVSLGI